MRSPTEFSSSLPFLQLLSSRRAAIDPRLTTHQATQAAPNVQYFTCMLKKNWCKQFYRSPSQLESKWKAFKDLSLFITTVTVEFPAWVIFKRKYWRNLETNLEGILLIPDLTVVWKNIFTRALVQTLQGSQYLISAALKQGCFAEESHSHFIMPTRSSCQTQNAILSPVSFTSPSEKRPALN